MLRMKHFVSRHSRFKNFSKEAAAQGLREEWLPSLENATLYSDFYFLHFFCRYRQKVVYLQQKLA